MTKPFEMSIKKIQPSQLYISKKKLAKVHETFNPEKIESLGVIPIKKLDDEIIYTDGHTRAFAAFEKGFKTILVEWDKENLDWEMYRICVNWCKKEKIFTIEDLKNRIIDHPKYEELWYKRCKKMQEEVRSRRISNTK